jgi:FkbM family methyltransferase
MVRQVRFDDVFSFRGDTILIKMDVEGSEFHALAGMERTLRDNLCIRAGSRGDASPPQS